MKKTKSPTPTNKKKVIKKNLTFYEALEAMLTGAKITKLEWGNEEIRGYLEGVLKLDTQGSVTQWVVNDGDILGEDWIIIK